MYTYGRVKHKVFISYYHLDDQPYKNYIDLNLSQNIINKSVRFGEYDSENSDEYIKRLIREDKISDSSVVIVLVGSNTKKRKHVDWEIYAALRPSINGNAGLIGIFLPGLKSDFEKYCCLPERLADNVKSEYATLYDWGYAISHFDEIIEKAYNDRITKRSSIDNTRIQKKYNG